MPQIINTNIASLNAQRNLNTSQSQLATSLQRLSSGLRINSAKDDAAGLAISERFSTQIRGLNQAVRNANDGISLSQTAEGSLAEISNNLQRIRELAVQAANATNSASDRAALDQEVQQRLAEVNRIASQTSFNGQKILDGSFGNASFQVGANVNETISIDLTTSMKTTDIGAYVNSDSDDTTAQAAATAAGADGLDGGAWQATTGSYTGVDDSIIDDAAGATTVEINGVTILDSNDYIVAGDSQRDATSAYAKAAAINASGVSGVTASATNVQTFDDGAVAADTFMRVGTLVGAADEVAYTLLINGEEIFTDEVVATAGSGTISVDDAVTAINSKQFDTGVVASKNDDGQLVLTAADGRNIDVDETFTFTDGTVANGSDNIVVESVFSTAAINETAGDDSDTLNQTATYRGQLTLTSSADITINQGQAILGFTTGTLTATGSIAAQDVTSVANANDTILAVDAALTSVSTLRSTFGAIQNRFESTIANLSATSENLTASRSRIQDTDFAAETAALTRSQILQQAGTAMLAQANALPNQVMTLLR